MQVSYLAHIGMHNMVYIYIYIYIYMYIHNIYPVSCSYMFRYKHMQTCNARTCCVQVLELAHEAQVKARITDDAEALAQARK